jgi:hypothetical protein
MANVSSIPVHTVQTTRTVQTPAQNAPVKTAPVKTPTARATDGDTAAQEAAESGATRIAEAQNGGFAPNSAGLVNKTA